MSGGHFDYKQYDLQYIKDEIEEIIEKNNTEDEYGYNFSEKTIQEFQTAIKKLDEAQIYAQRIDWLVSGDDGEETFHKRLKNDLDKNNL